MYPESCSEFDFEDQSLYFCDTVNIKVEAMADSGSETSDSPIYTDLSPAQYSPKLALLKQEKTGFEETFDNLLSWTSKHPEHWTNREVLDWVYYVADMKQFDFSQFFGERYQSVSGQKMCRMTREDFTAMDFHYGSVLYDLFQSLVTKSKFTEPQSPDSMNPDAYPFLDTTFPCLPVPYSPGSEAPSSPVEALPVFVNACGVTAADIDGYAYEFDVKTKIDIPISSIEDPGYVSAESEMESNCSNQFRCGSTSSDPFDVCNISDEDEIQPFNHHFSRSSKRPTSASSDEDMEDKSMEKRRRINSSSKGNHLWEFIRDLLKDPNLNPSLLKWEDKEAGVFKFVQSEAVANMWGRKKNNPGMTYEKLSRAMRFCRTAGYFGDVPKNGKFPKKLCFRFGPKAHDWK